VNRSSSLNDWLANAVGCVLGVLPGLLTHRFLRRRAQRQPAADAPPRPAGDPASTSI
jgi:uncharacterized membrane-anchored protein YhcB (DUF1043 family)